MKTVISLFSIMILSACTPEDNKINKDQVSTSVQNQGAHRGLRLGSYGIPIVITQNLEKTGFLTQLCLAQKETAQVQGLTNAEGLKIFKWNCDLTLESDSSQQSFQSETWVVEISIRADSHEIIKSTGRLQEGLIASQFKKESVTFDYRSKKFEMIFDENKNIELNITSLADLKSSLDTLNVHTKILSKGRIQNKEAEQVWRLHQMIAQVQVLNRNLKFALRSTELTLNWIKSGCAEAQGQIISTELGAKSSEALIAITSTQASLIPQGQQRPWSQKYSGCDNRNTPVQNFEFLLY